MKNTIKSHKNFDFKDCPVAPMPAFLMKFRPKKFDSGQYGLIASKRSFDRAVDRNRAKRLLRAWIAQNKMPKKADVVFIARRAVLDTKLSEGAGQMRKALKKIPKALY